MVILLTSVSLSAQTPTANFTFSPVNACSGTPIAFSNTSAGATSYFWEFGDGTTSTEVNPTHTFTANPGNGTQQFFVKLTARKGGQSANTTNTVEVFQPPDPSISAPTFKICGGSTTLNLVVTNSSTTNNSNYQIVWGNGGTLTSESFTSENHTYNGLGAWDLVFSVTGVNGCSNSRTYPVLIGGLPDIGASITGEKQGCAPLPINFKITDTESNVGTTYSLDFHDGTVQDGISQADLKTDFLHTYHDPSCSQPNQQYSFTVVATNLCGSSTASVSTGIVKSQPIAQINAPEDTICLGVDAFFYNATQPPCGADPMYPTTYQWEIEGLTYTSTNIESYKFTTPGISTVKLTVSNSDPSILSCNGGQSTASVDVLVIDSAIPAAPDTPTGPSAVCQGEQGVIFTVPPVTGATRYNWDLPAGTTIISGQGTNTIIVNFAPDVSPGTTTITVSGGNACQTGSASAPYSFTVNPLPTLGEIDGDPSLCQGQAKELTYTVTGITNADTYVWSVPPGATILGGEGTTSITVSFPANASSGSVTVYGKNGCGNGPAASLFVEVKPIPAGGALIGPTAACEGDLVSITASGISNADMYVWTLEDGSVRTVNQTTITKTITGGGSTATFTVYGANPCGLGDTLSYSFPVHPSPKTNFAPADHCQGNPAPLVDTTLQCDTTIISWEWDFGDGYGFKSSEYRDPVHVYADSGTYTISLRVRSNEGCNAQFDSTITVQPTPEAHHRPIPVRTSIVKPEVTFKDSSFFAHTFYWDFGDSTYSENRSPTHAYSKTGKFKVMEVAYSGFGCADTTYSTVTVFEGIFVPTAFMPRAGGGGGGGGAASGNDTGIFKPLFGVAAENSGYSFMVFNRWGEMVFSTTSPEEGWNGQVRNTGNDAPVGVYAWKVTYKELNTGKIRFRTGNVMLVR